MTDFPIARGFERKAEALLRDAESRGDAVYGMRPWYCSVSIIEKGAEVAFIGANPGGGAESEKTDKRLGVLAWPYDYDDYCAWLDDRHWEGSGPGHQKRAQGAFEILFGQRGQEVLRNAACFDVVPIRSTGIGELSEGTWQSGVALAMEVLAHVRPRLIVCNGNGEGKSAWGVFRGQDQRFGLEVLAKASMTKKFSLKAGRITRGELAGVEVIGLPHLARMTSLPQLEAAAKALGYPRNL